MPGNPKNLISQSPDPYSSKKSEELANLRSKLYERKRLSNDSTVLAKSKSRALRKC
jgi:hypothetical protein